MRKKSKRIILKGIWSDVELISYIIIFWISYQDLTTSIDEIPSDRVTFYLFYHGISYALGFSGIIYTQILRYRIRKNPHLQSKYCKEDQGNSTDKQRKDNLKYNENWPRMKRLAILFLIGILFWGLFIVFITVFT